MLVPTLLPVLLAAFAQGATPAPQDPAKARLERSTRHHEWVELDRGGRKLRCFVAWPETDALTPAVLVIHENKGLTDWVRAVADRLAEEGFLAVAPDLLSGAGPEGGGSASFASVDDATKALYALPAEQVLADLMAAADHAKRIPSCDGRLAVAGFCWGGSRTWEVAAARDDLMAAFVFYGSAPEDKAALARIDSPVYGFYGGRDARVNATLDATSAALKELEKTFEPRIYEGAGHGFLRRGEDADAPEADAVARAQAWERWLVLLRRE